jgi:hypothetical protein
MAQMGKSNSDEDESTDYADYADGRRDAERSKIEKRRSKSGPIFEFRFSSFPLVCTGGEKMTKEATI